MNTLWLVNVLLPEASSLMNEAPTPFGGWLVNTSTQLAGEEGINLAIAFPKIGLNEALALHGNRKTYYAFPPVVNKKLNLEQETKHLVQILELANPDIVHIFGTEYAHTLAMVNACNRKNIPVVISIQGLVSIISKHYLSGIPARIQKRFTLRDFLRLDNLRQQQKRFTKRGLLEIKALQNVKHVIGRTTWDRVCVLQINSRAQYHFCNETLRNEFYKHRWDINQCEKYSIIISQGSYPVKGLHFVLEAMSMILTKFPKAKLYVGGENITKSKSLKDGLKISSYGLYIRELTRKLGLKQHVIFTGLLDEKQMCQRYLKSHVFVCPSSIENSPNSLGEAMILGIPCVASYVGGIPDLLQDKEEGFLYQHDAPYMLAHYICEIFKNEDLALKFSKNAREHALKTHDSDENTRKLMGIYKEILE